MSKKKPFFLLVQKKTHIQVSLHQLDPILLRLDALRCSVLAKQRDRGLGIEQRVRSPLHRLVVDLARLRR